MKNCFRVLERLAWRGYVPWGFWRVGMAKVRRPFGRERSLGSAAESTLVRPDSLFELQTQHRDVCAAMLLYSSNKWRLFVVLTSLSLTSKFLPSKWMPSPRQGPCVIHARSRFQVPDRRDRRCLLDIVTAPSCIGVETTHDRQMPVFNLLGNACRECPSADAAWGYHPET
ncbi:hypothetical protein BT67DRAFT_53318 [Trichocladium antarcticum]|uniref:Uncharacterized protein n=1 Tax=Trichocladium antarcticum TaxID=1450529 RepID=A0AAN6UIU0_9PEZI|nr:hypothetical protein BT67DRAFT_53318 [Trichocladium antarcticum]